MNCNEYLSLLATLPVDELSHGPAREHSAFCHDCDRVTREVVSFEQTTRRAFDDARSSLPAALVAVHTLETARRRNIVRYFKAAVGIAIAAGVMIVVVSRVAPVPARVPVAGETFRLQCLSPEQAAVVIKPFISPGSLISIPSRSLGVITVQASNEEMQKVRSILDHYDNAGQAQCAVQVTVPKTP